MQEYELQQILLSTITIKSSCFEMQTRLKPRLKLTHRLKRLENDRVFRYRN